MRDTSTTFIGASYAQETSEAELALITISHADLATPYYFVDHAKAITSRGQSYIAFPFRYEMPIDSATEMVRVNIVIDNVSRQIIAAIRSLDSPPQMTLELILASEPDTVIAGPIEMELVSADWNEMNITGQLGYENTFDQRWPKDDFTPADFLGLF